MKIEVSGSRCVSCHFFTQYYAKKWDGEVAAIDCGYCGTRSRNVRPGDRCKEYQERSNVCMPLGVAQAGK